MLRKPLNPLAQRNHRSKASQRAGLANGQLNLEALEDRLLLAADTDTSVFGNEPDIAVSPVDPSVMAVGSARDDTLRISTDFGESFPVTVNAQRPAGLAAYGFAGDPSLGFSADGDTLYWSYLLSMRDGDDELIDLSVIVLPIDVSNPASPTAGTPVDLTPGDFVDDKQWIAIDDDWDSPFVDNVYLSWTRLGDNDQVLFSRSTDGALTFSAPQSVSVDEGFVWPSHVETAPNGDVYVGYHTDTCGSPNAAMQILRDTTGGVDLAAGNSVQKTSFQSAVTCNVQDEPAPIPQTDFWMQGANAPYIVADPIRPGHVYVIANDDPNNDFTSGDPGDVIVARSTNNGQSWNVSTVSHSPEGTLQVMPTGAIDENGNLAIFWYDTQNGNLNGNDNLLLDVYATVSNDGGLTYTNDFRINDASFNPDLGAPTRFDGPPPTLRIGEYNGIRASNGVAYATWTGNDGLTQGIFFDMFDVAGAYPDAYEVNNSIPTASILGSLPAITLQDATLHDQHDVDYYKYTAAATGKLITNLFFNDGVADLELEVLDVEGNVISFAGMDEITPGLDVEGFVIPVVSQEEYVIRVRRNVGDVPGNPVQYDLEIENYAAPVPNAVWLDPTDDTGMMNNDNVTREDESRILIEADLSDFASMGIDILTPTEVITGDDGAAVVVIVNGAEIGTATPLVGTGNTLFEFTFAPGDLSTTLIPTGGGGGLNAVKAAVRMFDGQDNRQNGRTEESEPLLLTLDQSDPDLIGPVLLSSSDTGMNNTDNVTNKMQPAFGGTTEPNAKVRVLADGVIVGQGVATPGGNWEITVEPLRDGAYVITAQAEDLAGNIMNSVALDPILVVDTEMPNTPFLDLLNDTGHTATDNITGDNLLNFLMVGNDTVVGDGNPPPNDLKYRLYWRPGDNTGEVLIYDSFLEFGEFTSQGELTRIVSQDLNDAIGIPFPDGVHNFKLEVEDRAGNISHDFLLDVEIDASPPVDATLDLITSSDTGMNPFDDVTNKMQPAFNGLSEVNAIVTLYAQEVDATATPIGPNFVVGTGTVGSDLTDNVPDDGLGIWEITSEPLDDGSYFITALIEDWAGGFVVTDRLQIWVDTIRPNTPRLDLVSDSDSGRNDTDNITNDVRPTMTINANDTIDGDGNLLPNGLKYRLYVRPDGDLSVPEILVIDSFAELGGFTTDNIFTEIVTLGLNNPTGPAFPDGIHNFKLEIEDRAGNLSEHFLLDVEFDTVAPVKFFGDPTIGDDGLHPESDSGLPGQPQTLDDRVTNDATPTFWGRAEANSVIVARLPNGTFVGETVAVPFDGNDAFPGGRWELTSGVDLSLGGLGSDGGLRTIVITAEDVAGNVTSEMTLDIFLDVVGPRVNDIFVTDDPDYTLFDPKPSVDGPSPLVDSLSVVITDLPHRVFDFLYTAANRTLLEQGGNIDVFGDHVGQVVIDSIEVEMVDIGEEDLPGITVSVNFAEPLPDDRYTIIVSDRISDNAGNALDGDHLTADPRGGGAFPSGDGQPGGDFVARFTIDSRPEIGTWAGGSVYIDANGNNFFDPDNRDDVNEDLVFEFAYPSDDVFAGNFVAEADDVADGFDKLAAYGDASQPSNSTGFRWKIDLDNDGVPNDLVFDSANVNGLPFAGRFDNLDFNGDEVGIFTGNRWYLDTNHDFRVDVNFSSQLRGYPIAGDFDGDSFDDLATYNEQKDRFEFDLTDGDRRGFDGSIDAVVYTGFPGVRERPVAADMDGDGFDDFGLWVPDRSGVTPRASAEWYILVSGGNSLLDRIVNDLEFNNPTIPFEPTPFGNDFFAQFGDEFALPILGNFDPPVTIKATNLTNAANSLDVNADAVVSPLDALMVINALNGNHASSGSYYPDTNADGEISPLDALLVINALDGSAARSSSGDDLLPGGHLSGSSADAASLEQDEDAPWDDVIGNLAVDWLGFTIER